MSFALSAKKIRCPNCNFEGKAKVQGTGGGLTLLAIILFVLGFVIWPFFFLAPILILIDLLRPAEQICPKCKWKHPIPI